MTDFSIEELQKTHSITFIEVIILLLLRAFMLCQMQSGSPSLQSHGMPDAVGPMGGGGGMMPNSVLYGGGFGSGGGFGGPMDTFGPGPGMPPGFVPQDGPIGAQNLGWGPTLQQQPPSSPPGPRSSGGGRGRGRSSGKGAAGKPSIRGGKGRGKVGLQHCKAGYWQQFYLSKAGAQQIIGRRPPAFLAAVLCHVCHDAVGRAASSTARWDAIS